MGRGPKPAKSKEAKPPVARKSPKNDGARVSDLENRLTEALEQQTATANILRVISRAHAGLDLVLDAVLKIGTRLCEAKFANIFLYNGETFELAVAHGAPTAWVRRLWRGGPLRFRPPFFRPEGPWRVLHVADLKTTAPYLERDPMWVHAAEEGGVRTFLAVPLVKEGRFIGTLMIYRQDVRLFTDRQIGLLETFADQAVIAIENVRLFTELQEKNTALTQAHAQVSESLDQQTATSEILQIISSSFTDVQPVFDAIVRTAVRLIPSRYCNVYRVEGDRLHIAANHGMSPAGMIEMGRRYPALLSAPYNSVRAVRERSVIHQVDANTDPALTEGQRRVAQIEGFRSQVFVPMLQGDRCVGVICLTRPENERYPESQVTLLKTFADQAVIAIENVRLFKELEARNRDLTESLEQQTATAEILRIISRSPTDVQPVFDSVVANAVRLCHGKLGVIYRYDGELVHLVTHYNVAADALEYLLQQYPRPATAKESGQRAIRERRIVQIEDFETDPDVTEEMRTGARLRGSRSNIAVPLLRDGSCVGCIVIGKPTPGYFPDKQVELLKTFADQAVIAIENVRLFKELQSSNRDLTEALEQQTATSEVLRTIAQTKTDLQPVLDEIVRSAAKLCHAHTAAVFVTDGRTIHHPANYGDSPEALAAIKARFPRPLDRETAAGNAILTRSVIHVPDVEEPTALEFVRQTGRAIGFRSLLSMPMLRQDEAVGAINVTRHEPGPFSEAEVALLKTFADQAVIALENVRLFRELEGANRELSAASQHKSEFLANMSHELRTPLNAIIGFSEVLSEKMFGELNEKQEEYSKDIHASGQHLLSLINDILDLSKIEAGRMELELSDFHLPTALDSALTLVRERAGRRSIALHLSVDERLGEIQADERKVRQVVLNLLSNAIKFTPEGGRIDVAAMPKDGFVEVSVSDTGVGIALEDQEAVFEEFRQVGTADKKVEGTGLGLTLCRKFVELHGGRIWVKSELGAGSTFTFTIPVRHGE